LGKLVGFLFFLVILAAGSAGAGWFWLNSVYTATGPATEDGKPRLVVVEKGAATQAIAASLKEAGAIADAEQFRLALRLREFMGDRPVMKAGEYLIASGASMEAIVGELTTGASTQYAVVVPEGLSTSQIIELLSSETWNTTDPAWKPTDEEIAAQRAAYSALPAEQRQKAFRAKWGLTYKLGGEAPTDIPEGVLLPGDFAVSRGDTIADVVKRMRDAQAALLTELWEKRAPDIPVKTKEEAVILASIVEKETGNADEQPTVAGLYSNRLRQGMRLQADATIVYAITRGKGPLGRDIAASEIRAVNDWNTYSMSGLPKTPICNPGKGAIAAVLNPANTKAIFMMADGTGGHKFAETNAEHERNSAEYWILRRKNEAAGVNTPAVRPQQR
jgi:UPF0755 protein